MNWEDINKKHNFEFNRLIMCMPDDVRKEIDQLWKGGALNPYRAAERVLQQRAMSDKPVDLVEVDRLYEEKFVCKKEPKKPKRKSFADLENDFVDEIANRAEVLAAMDCLMHHLKNEDQLKQWTGEIVPDEYNWNILDWDPAESAERTRAYMELAKSMSRQRFERCVHLFACIVRSEVFAEYPREGVFSFVSSGGKEV